MKIFLFYTLILIFFSTGCGNDSSHNDSVFTGADFFEKSADSTIGNIHDGVYQYDLNNPKRTWKLPSSLVEVSGNTWLNKTQLLLIEDNLPNLYLVNLGDERLDVEKVIPLRSNRKGKLDLEGVSIVNGVVYALSSYGVLFKIQHWNTTPEIKEIPTFLSEENNTEGLSYDPVTKNLLVACKLSSGIKGEDASTKAVYAFDLTTERLDEKPFLVIHKDDFSKMAGRELDFYPSAIAVHPLTQNIYLLSTRENKCMAVFNREGDIISFQFIDENLLPQPEGICFSPDGVLFISTEGKKGPGKLLEFKME